MKERGLSERSRSKHNSKHNWVLVVPLLILFSALFISQPVKAQSPLAIATISLPDATTGSSYIATFIATGGMPPYGWTITISSLPLGLSLDSATGIISGVPPNGSAGTYGFTATVTDKNGTSVSKPLHIIVVNAIYMGENQTEWKAKYDALMLDYNTLLASYTSLKSDYDSLYSNFSSLKTNFDNVQGNYSILCYEYASLNTTYNELVMNYAKMEADYDTLLANYSFLSAQYNELRGDYDHLNLTYYSLRGELDSLNINYEALQAAYDRATRALNDANWKANVLMGLLGIAGLAAILLKMRPIESWPWPFTPKEAKERLCTRLQAEISALEQEIAKMSKELDLVTRNEMFAQERQVKWQNLAREVGILEDLSRLYQNISSTAQAVAQALSFYEAAGKGGEELLEELLQYLTGTPSKPGDVALMGGEKLTENVMKGLDKDKQYYMKEYIQAKFEELVYKERRLFLDKKLTEAKNKLKELIKLRDRLCGNK